MPRLSPSDHYILKKLVSDNRIDLEQVDELVQMLDLHRAKDQRASITDLLLKRKIVTASELNKLLWEAEEAEKAPKEAPVRPDSAPTPLRQAPIRKTASRPSPSSSPIGLILAGLLFVGVLGTVAWFVFDEVKNDRADEGDTTRVTNNGSAAPAKPKDSSVTDRTDEPPADLSIDRIRRRLAATLAQENLRIRLDEIDYLCDVCAAGTFKDELIAKYEEELAKADVEAQLALDKAMVRIDEHYANSQYKGVVDEYTALLDRFGSRVLDRKLDLRLRHAERGRDRAFGEGYAEANTEYLLGNLPLAERMIRHLLTYADAEQKEKAEKLLAKVEKEKKPEEPLIDPDELAKITKPKDSDSSDSSDTEGSEQDTDKDPEAEKIPPRPMGSRISRIAARLSEFLHVKNATLAGDGTLTLTYDFEQKRLEDALDWGPQVSDTPVPQDKLRWTLAAEDENEYAGIRISNKGVFLHKVRLHAPVEIEVKLYNYNQFHSKNAVAVCWMTPEGKGVGGVYGRQSCELSKGFKVKKRKPVKLPELVSRQTYDFSLTVAEGKYKTSTRGYRPSPRNVPRTLVTGQVGLVWTPNIAATIRRVTIKGVLDLVWAEEQLKAGGG